LQRECNDGRGMVAASSARTRRTIPKRQSAVTWIPNQVFATIYAGRPIQAPAVVKPQDNGYRWSSINATASRSDIHHMRRRGAKSFVDDLVLSRSDRLVMGLADPLESSWPASSKEEEPHEGNEPQGGPAETDRHLEQGLEADQPHSSNVRFEARWRATAGGNGRRKPVRLDGGENP